MRRDIVNAVCKFYIVLCFVGGILLLISGIIKIMENQPGSYVSIILGVALPLSSVLITYPLMALASIDKNIEKLNDQVEELTEAVNKKTDK